MAKHIQHFWILLNTCPENYSSSFYYISTKPGTSEQEDWISPAIVLLTSTAALLLPVLANGRRLKGDAPATIISGGITSAYHAFVVAVMFAFSCAISAVFLRRKQAAATRVFRLCAVMWITFAFLLLIRAAIFGIYDLLVMQMN